MFVSTIGEKSKFVLSLGDFLATTKFKKRENKKYLSTLQGPMLYTGNVILLYHLFKVSLD